MPWPFDLAPSSHPVARPPGDMELQMRSYPWEATPAGPVRDWSTGLKTAVRLLLDCQVPMLLLWGRAPVRFVNDACMALLGQVRAAEQLWAVIGPLTAPVWQGAVVREHAVAVALERGGVDATCHFSLSCSPAYGDDGRVGGILATLVETTDQVGAACRQAERDQLLASERAARAEAERHNEMKDEFLAMLAHELRNPLAPITSAAQLLRLPEVDDSLRLKASHIISRQVRHMTALVDDLLDVSRVTRGLIRLENDIVDLNKVAMAAIEQARPHIEERRHTLTVELPDVPVPVQGDRTRLVQVLVNLLNNAAKYTPPGGSILLAVASDGSAAEVRVRDNGSGIDARLLPYVFDLFTQAERTPDRAQGGLGIGLALVKSIVRMHDGQVQAHSDGPQRGTTLTVTLPLAHAEVGQIVRSGEDGGTAQPLVVTVVDDNADAGQSLAVLLRAHGHTVHLFEDGHATLHATGAATEVFVLDIGLPDMTGYELARRLRADPRYAHAAFVALTGYGQPRDRASSKQAGFDHHLVKPVEIGKLARILATVGRR